MIVRKMQIVLVLIIMVAVVLLSGGTVQAVDSIGRMPEITVTAPRYEYQDDAWAGMVEGVIVEAQRRSGSDAVAAKAGLEPYIMFTGSEPLEEINDISMKLAGSTYMSFSLVLNLALVPLSLIYISLSVFLRTKEVKK